MTKVAKLLVRYNEAIFFTSGISVRFSRISSIHGVKRGVSHGSAAAHLLELRVGILTKSCMLVSCQCCVFSDGGLRGGHPSSGEVLPSVGVSS